MGELREKKIITNYLASAAFGKLSMKPTLLYWQLIPAISVKV